jgi:hypothetical protein
MQERPTMAPTLLVRMGGSAVLTLVDAVALLVRVRDDCAEIAATGGRD